MILIAVDACLAACQVAVLQDDRIVAALSEPMHRGHQERIAPMAAEVMDAAGLAFDDVDAIGVTLGPGSFTGLRVGLAFAKGLALALATPIAGVGTLHALAACAHGPRCAVIDAGRGRLYLQAFEAGDGLAQPQILELEAAVEALRLSAVRTLIGPGASLAAAALTGVEVEPREAPDIADVARLAAAAGPGRVEPLYLRPADAIPKSQRLIR
ncbi:MAG TPA: tRNA (adenosine(37)-N6)-threonylcarbamoyltransferase complex dimerization subunit type 1 TsaB [Caulobacteraceae bacterium]|nr:tRNA (adenosine(37)-N6)-threonylcarbamoyltransferase complex dimerization subunit type 1 TsaB [Caulobacteraceae bacterium]